MRTAEEVVREAFDRIWNGGDIDAVETLYAESYVPPPFPPGAVQADVSTGPRAMRAFVAAFRAPFPDMRIEILDTVVQGAKVATRWRSRATHLGPFMGIPATGRAIDVGGIFIERVEGGKIVESTGHWDMLTLLEQIGLFSGRR
jgi:steroid delta-isomerase-like uncharacterized protein